MSSVLFPVGPHPPKVYWIRRGVVLGLPLILILVIAVACSGGGGKPSAGRTPSPGTTSSPSASQTASPNAACAPGQLSATLALSAANGIYTVGQSPVFTATITNVSASACQFTSAAANEIWTVWTGPDKFWTTAGCPAADTSSTKRLAAGAIRQITITWDGKRLDPGCTHGAPATHGTYVLHARLDGVSAKPVVFHFHDAGA